MKVYRIHTRDILIKSISIIIVLNALFAITTKNYDLASAATTTLIILTVEFLVSTLFKKLIKIEIDEQSVKLYFVKLIALKQTQEISLDDFQFSYKDEYGAKGVRTEQLRFYHQKEKIIGVGNALDGWRKNTIFEIINDLNEKGVEEIF